MKLIDMHHSVTVVGLGLTGYSAVRYLHSCGLSVSVVDTRSNPPFLQQLKQTYSDVDVHVGDFNTKLVHDAELLVVSPGVSLDQEDIRIAKQNHANVVGDIELFVETNTKSLIAITGSNGKSTVTKLVGEMCEAGGYKALVAGNIGLPALDALVDGKDYDIAVLELSSFQLEGITQLDADSVAILNVSEDHLDRYSSMGDYLLAKAKILKGAKHIVLPRHDEALKQITVRSEGLLSFDLDEPGDNYGIKRMSNYRWLLNGNERLIKLRDIPLAGLHNVKNVLAAYALVEFLQIDKVALRDAVINFVGLPHRMQKVVEHAGVTWVNDSKATNVGATSTALLGMEKDVVWIAGGQGKGADFSELRNAIQSHIRELVLFGEDADAIEQSLDGLLPISRVRNLKEAVKLASQKAQENSVVLLSPACASMDMFHDYQDRGDQFMSLVKQITNNTMQENNGGSNNG